MQTEVTALEIVAFSVVLEVTSKINWIGSFIGDSYDVQHR